MGDIELDGVFAERARQKDTEELRELPYHAEEVAVFCRAIGLGGLLEDLPRALPGMCNNRRSDWYPLRTSSFHLRHFLGV